MRGEEDSLPNAPPPGLPRASRPPAGRPAPLSTRERHPPPSRLAAHPTAAPRAATSAGGGGSGGEKELKRRLKRLYPAVDEQETPLPRSWSPKDKFSYIGLSQNNLRVHYKGHGKTPKDAASVRATHPIPAACGIYYFEVKIVSKGRDGAVFLWMLY
uniref:Uncharacterized protein n=1 Tax=Gallus gallus TaxID=9031 RepID=A0A8V0XYM5_CHICK